MEYILTCPKCGTAVEAEHNPEMDELWPWQVACPACTYEKRYITKEGAEVDNVITESTA